MQINFKSMGSYQTNCYIIYLEEGELIIDPGMGATDWVIQNVKNPLAILNTHGHFDHVWSNHELQEKLKIPLYCPKDDVFMLQFDPYSLGLTPSVPDVEVDGDEVYRFGATQVKYWYFPGHTPGCSAIEIEDALFSGDFIFKNSIGRVDFPYSNPEDMKQSIHKFLRFEKDLTLYPGHGEFSSVQKEQKNLPAWLTII